MVEYSPAMGFLKAEDKVNRYFRCWYGDEFCHYTNLYGLLGIIQSSGIWLSDYRFLNDKSEYTYGQKIALNAIQAFASDLPTSSLSEYLKFVESRIRENNDRSYFVASFSKKKDCLDQWKGYGADGGSVCLVFENDSNLGREAFLVQGPTYFSL